MPVFAVLAGDHVEEGLLQRLGDRTRLAGADLALIQLADWRDLGGGTGEEALVGDVDVVARQALRLYLVAEATDERVMPVSAEVSSGS
jgi:hypothetical protein